MVGKELPKIFVWAGGEKLYGSASSLPPQERHGRWGGDRRRQGLFHFRFQEAFEGTPTEHKNFYVDNLCGKWILFQDTRRLQIIYRRSSSLEKRTRQSKGRLLWHTTRSSRCRTASKRKLISIRSTATSSNRHLKERVSRFSGQTRRCAQGTFARTCSKSCLWRIWSWRISPSITQTSGMSSVCATPSGRGE